MGKKKTDPNLASESRVTLPPKTVAPRAARRKAPLAPEAIAEFTALPLAPELDLIPEPVVDSSTPPAVTRPEPIPEARAAWLDRRPLDMLRDLLVKVRAQLKQRVEARLSPILQRFPWIVRRFTR